jgi:hypothetical protein
MSEYKPICKMCGHAYKYGRLKKGYAVCLPCGDEIAHERKFTIVPLNKSNYIAVSDMAMLKQLNPKRTT